MAPLITLLTDFGYRDGYAGIMAGVIHGINPQANIVDMAHNIDAGDIRSAAFVLRQSYPYFPPQSIHVVVVDPGVGSSRKAIVCVTPHRSFVAPDNGVLSPVFRHEECKVYALTNRRYWLETVSSTFHGRDIFAPVAAHLSAGVPVEELGEKFDDYVLFEQPEPVRRENEIIGEILYCDRFGNLVTNFPSGLAGEIKVVHIGKVKVNGIVSTFSEVGPLEPLALVGSHGYIEIAVNGGSAAELTGCGIGARVVALR